jgi:hypothetical protein
MEHRQMKKSLIWVWFFMVIFAGLFACGGNSGGVDNTNGEVNPPDSTETYEVTGPGTWSMTATEGGSDTLIFSNTSDELSWVDYSNGYGTGIPFLVWSRVLLQYPITEGDTWSESGGSNGYDMEMTTSVEDINATVEVKAGTFTSCVVTVETTDVDPAYNNGSYIEVRTRYFAPALGLVKVVDTWHTGEVTTGELTEYEVHNPDPGDYFPLALGDRWKFKWTTN